MVELFETDMRDNGRKSSKGNQLKWENNGIWYKADYLGYEGLAECAVSRLLRRSDLGEEEFVFYEPEEIRYKDQIYKGCKSRDFSGEWQIITLERLFKEQFGVGLNQGIYSIADPEERMVFLVEQVERTTGLKDIGIYMTKLFAIDALFLNEDRHTHNISVLMNGKGDFKLCPVYDNGAALLSDLRMDYPLGCDIYREIGNVKAKTICDSFDEQLEVAEKLYGKQLSFSFSAKDIDACMEDLHIYEPAIRERVTDILREQKRRYKYMFREVELSAGTKPRSMVE
ncbi:MAG: hypothetical protein K6C95_10100 [Lachnospiraceae bacterium]|nr:hypothetical protein [Lachnospiraceae bacterium]